MPIAKLNRVQLQTLAEDRLVESRVLLDARHFTGSYYMAGLSVECAFKAYLSSKVREHDFPDKDFVNSAYIHKLDKLAQLDAALWAELRNETGTRPRLGSNWSIVKDWDDGRRYDFVDEATARDLYDAVAEADGVLPWLRRRW